MNMAGDQFFASAGFANDQHAGFAGCDLLQMRQQSLGFRIFEHLRGGADRRGQGG
jgi:hypothetical protein